MEKDCIFKIYRVKFYSKKLDKGDPNVTIEHSTAQHSTAQHSTAQHSTAQHSTLNKRVYLACTKTDLLTQIKSFSFIDEKDFSIVINRKVVA